jgi:hypothetical protein
MTEDQEHDRYVALNYGENHKEIGATLKFVVWYQENHFPDKTVWHVKEHHKILELFREHVLLLSLSKNRAVSRQEAFKLLQ